VSRGRQDGLRSSRELGLYAEWLDSGPRSGMISARPDAAGPAPSET
jgi:hypothetical protein